MELTCQRCGETLSTEVAFCPHCAAPQLRWIQPDPDPPEAGSESQPADPSVVHRNMQWDAAIRIALLTSLVTGILCSLLSLGTLLWIAAGTAATIIFYRRRHPGSPVDSRFGTRIGFLFGLLTATVLTIADAGVMFLQRYVLHQGNKFDQAYTSMLDQLAGRAPSNPAAIAQWNALMQFWHLPEARAGLYVSSAAFLALLVIVLSGAAGAITARMSAPRGSNA